MNQLEKSFSHNIIEAFLGQNGKPLHEHKPEELLNFMIQYRIIKKASIRDFAVQAEFNRLMAIRRYRNKTATVEALAMTFDLKISTIWSIVQKAEKETRAAFLPENQ